MRLVGLVCFAVFVFLMTSWATYGHSWYDRDCCDDKDCRPSPPGEITVVPGGYEFRLNGTGKVHFYGIGDAHLRLSQDGKFHACVIHYSDFPRCIYVIGGGV
jgi:hypothetical protein